MTASPAPRSNPIRHFGRFELRQLLGKSGATMVWLVHDPQHGEELMLSLPRVQPADAVALERWTRDVRFAARLNHPHITGALEIGAHEHWPYVAVSRQAGVTLAEWLATHPQPALDQIALWLCDVLQGLAFAHEAGVAHLDLQLHSIAVNERGSASVMALASAGDAARRAVDGARPGTPGSNGLPMDPELLRSQRAASVRDVLACGVLLHRLIAAEPALELADTAAVMDHMAPAGRELVRLPWKTPLPVPEALRAIANRCTSSQERLRYQSARTLLGALQGWREASTEDDAGPVARLIDRLRNVGHLPALPGLAARVARITGSDGRRTDEMAQDVLHDMALTFELLRTLNSAQVQGTQIAGEPPVLTLKRIISLIGVDGVRQAANTLRSWPGPLDAPAAAALKATMDHARLAGHTAQALRPAGYDPQVVYLIAVLQNLGRLMLRYHFADEAEQIQQLTLPVAARPDPAKTGVGAAEQPGLKEDAAAFAVLGVDVDTLCAAVARQWGLADELVHMMRRLPSDAPVRRPDSDADMLRLVASAANEAVDAIDLPLPARRVAALAAVVQRHGRVLSIGMRDLQDALQNARAVMDGEAPPRAPAARAAERAPDPGQVEPTTH